MPNCIAQLFSGIKQSEIIKLHNIIAIEELENIDDIWVCARGDKFNVESWGGLDTLKTHLKGHHSWSYLYISTGYIRKIRTDYQFIMFDMRIK